MSTQHALLWLIFALTYLGIAMGRFPRLVLDRTGIALLGAIAMLVVRGASVEEAARHIDKSTILLLFGLMIFSAQLRVAGFHELVGRRLAGLLDRPRTLLAGVILISALVSALLANDVVCLAFTPLLCSALLGRGRNPLPYLLALAAASNIGSAATIIGNPQNMYIGSVAHLSFAHYAAVMAVPVAVGLCCCWCTLVLIFRRELAAPPAPSAVWSPTSLPEPDAYLIAKSLLLLAVVVVVFLVVGPNAETRAVAALAGAGVLLCSRRIKAARLYQLVDFNLLLLFCGLFVVNGAMQDQHLTDAALAHLQQAGLHVDHPLTLSAVTLVLSNLVSNVPAVLLLQQPVAAAHSLKLWYILALVSTWAGNLTLVGSIANLIVAESAAAYGVKLNLKTYCKAGIPLTLITVTLGVAWLMLVM